MPGLINLLIYLIIWGVIFWVLWWGLNKIAPPEPFMKVGTVLLVLLTIVVVLNALFGFIGKPIMHF